MLQPRRPRTGRTLAVAVVPALTALALAGCGGGDDGDSGSSEEATGFTFVYPTSNNVANPWQGLVDRYADETGIEIETSPQPNDSYGVTLRTQLQGGNAATLMVTAPGRGQDYSALLLADGDLLEPLDGDSAGVIPEGSEDLFQIDGDTFGQPTDLVPVGITFNPTAAEDAGVSVPEDTDELIDSCAGLTGEGKSYFAVAGSAAPNTGLMAMVISATRVYAEMPDWNQQRAEGETTFAETDGWAESLQTILDLQEAGCFQAGVEGGGFDAITIGLTTGSSLGGFTPGGAAQDLMSSNEGLTLVIEPFPPASGGDPYIFASPNYSLSINAAADDAEKTAAQDFLDWLAEPENSAAFTEISGNVPITGATADNLAAQYEPVADLLENGDYSPLPNVAWPDPAVYDALSTGVQSLLTGQTDVDAVLQAMDEAWPSDS